MLAALLPALCLGILAGTITGITPGVHINLVATLVLAASGSAWLAGVAPLHIAVFLLAMSVTHTFLDAIPSVFLGVAEGSEVLLPGQRLVLEGNGMIAVMLLTLGALTALVASVLLVPLLVWIFPPLYRSVAPHTAIILIAVLAFAILRERHPNKRFWTFVVTLAAGCLGIIVLDMLTLEDPLLPMLTGLFGCSALVHSMTQNPTLPEQRRASVVVGRGTAGACAIASTIAGGAISLLPGMGPAQAATLVRVAWPRIGEEAYLLLLGGINTANMSLSLVTIAALGFARNGSLEIMRQLSSITDWRTLGVLAGVALVAGGAAAALAVLLGRAASSVMTRVNYALMSGCVLLLVVGLVSWRTGPIGLLILLVASATGLVAVLTGAARQQLMACIMVPVILALLGR